MSEGQGKEMGSRGRTGRQLLHTLLCLRLLLSACFLGMWRLGWRAILTHKSVLIPVYIWPDCPFAPNEWLQSEINFWGVELYWSLLVQLIILDLCSLLSNFGVLSESAFMLSFKKPFSSSSWQHYVIILWFLAFTVVHVPDMTLWEPYQIILPAMMMCFVILPGSHLHHLILVWQYITISMYFFAGAGKINLDFMTLIIPLLLNAIVRPIVLPTSVMIFSQYAIPIFETVTPALLLCFRKKLAVRRVLAFLLVAMHVNIIVYIIRDGHPPIILPWNMFHLLADCIIFFPADPIPYDIAYFNPSRKDTKARKNKKDSQVSPAEVVWIIWKYLLYLFFLILPLMSAIHPPLVPHGGLGMKIFVLSGESKWSLWAPKDDLDILCPYTKRSCGLNDIGCAASENTQLDSELCSLLRFLHDAGPSGRSFFSVQWNHLGIAPRGGLTSHHRLQYAKHMCRRVSSLISTTHFQYSRVEAAAEMVLNTLIFSFYTPSHRFGGRDVSTLDCTALKGVSNVSFVEFVPDLNQLRRPLQLTVRNEIDRNILLHIIDGRMYSVEFRNDLASPVYLMWHPRDISRPAILQAILQPGEVHRRLASSHNELWSYRDDNSTDAVEIRRFYTHFPSLFVETANSKNLMIAPHDREVMRGRDSEIVFSGTKLHVQAPTDTIMYMTGQLSTHQGENEVMMAVFVPYCTSGCGHLVMSGESNTVENGKRFEEYDGIKRSSNFAIQCEVTCAPNRSI